MPSLHWRRFNVTGTVRDAQRFAFSSITLAEVQGSFLVPRTELFSHRTYLAEEDQLNWHCGPDAPRHCCCLAKCRIGHRLTQNRYLNTLQLCFQVDLDLNNC